MIFKKHLKKKYTYCKANLNLTDFLLKKRKRKKISYQDLFSKTEFQNPWAFCKKKCDNSL